MDKPANDHLTFYPRNWKSQMRQLHGPPAPPTPAFKVEYKVRKKHLTPAERIRRTFRVVE